MHTVVIDTLKIGQDQPLALMLGPCVIESLDSALLSCEKILEQIDGLDCQFIYKSSFDKANRSSIDSFRGPGLEKGLEILQKVKEEFHVPVVSDIHLPQEANLAKDVLDCIQIPAFLCRQTDLILAAAETKKALSIKKGQFIAAEDMNNVVEKIESVGNRNILLTERGSCFGYHNLINDIRSIPVMQSLGYPVVYDATHSVQVPGGKITKGNSEFIPVLTKAHIAAGANALFMECHLDPKNAKSDKHNVFPIENLRLFLEDILALYTLIQNQKTSYAQV
ncbi:MAG: 2-dehydro-3-deoxyphosphooctonate aldolase [Chlamydiae bacterium]|nr:2-dehydro-3-deoxyphosphooctonate aldolase [Chlamydiota bacterium]